MSERTLPLPSAVAPARGELLPIREVARLTGVNPVTLRAWERRYGLITPVRTDSGHRLYSQADVETVRSIRGWIARGVSVSRVGDLLVQRCSAELPTHAEGEAMAWEDWRERLEQALGAFDQALLEQVHARLLDACPPQVAFSQVLMPAWQALSQQVRAGARSEWLMLDTFLRSDCLQQLQASEARGGELLLLAALPGACRELELLVTALWLADGARRVRVLGPGQPLEELGLVCEKVRPQALVLFSNHAPTAELPRQLIRLGLRLNCPLALAGLAAELAEESLAGTAVARLGASAPLMVTRLEQWLAGHLDT